MCFWVFPLIRSKSAPTFPMYIFNMLIYMKEEWLNIDGIAWNPENGTKKSLFYSYFF